MTSAAPQFVYVLPGDGKDTALAHFLLPQGQAVPSADVTGGGLPAGLVLPQHLLGVSAQGPFQHASGALSFGAPHLLLGHHTAAGAAPQQRRGDSADARPSKEARSSREGGASRNGSRALPDEDGPGGGSSSDDPAGEQQPGGKRGANIKEKNREAQRRFRARQKVLISGLKENMEAMQTRVAKQEQELTCLREENAVLRQLLASAQQTAAAAAIAAAAGNNNNSHHAAAAAAAAGAPANGAHALAPAPSMAAMDGMALMQRLDSASLGSTIFLHPMAGTLAQPQYLQLHPQQLLNVVMPAPKATTDTSVGTAPAAAAEAAAAAPAEPQPQPQPSNSGKAATTEGVSS